MSSAADLATDAQERHKLGDLVRSFLLGQSSESATCDAMESVEGYDREVWARCCQELELTSLIVPTGYGGMGYGWRELGVVLQEMGARLYPSPFLSTIFATTALLRLCSEQARTELLPGIAAGTTLAAFAHARTKQLGGTRNTLRCSNSCGNETLAVSGTLDLVLDAHVADRLVVLTSLHDRDAVLLIDARDPGVRVAPLLDIDQSRRFSRVDLTNTVAREITSRPLASGATTVVFALITTALAAEQIGGADEAFRAAVEYLRTRTQSGGLGRRFQAIDHDCAGTALDLESARLACQLALEAADRGSADLVLQARAAAAACSQAYVTLARQMFQLRSAVGFTRGHSARLHLRRAKTSQMMLGINDFHPTMIGREPSRVHSR